VLHTTSEQTLGAMLGDAGARAFAWLRELSFVQFGAGGVFPHDLARDVILGELRWRNPARLAELALKAQRLYTTAMRAAQGDALLRLLDDYTFVVGHNPKLRMMMVHPDDGLAPDALAPGDAAVLVEAAAAHEGPESAARLSRWIAVCPRAFRVVRNEARAIAAFGLYLRLDQLGADVVCFDPVAEAARAHAARLLGGAVDVPVLYARFLLSPATGHAPSSPMGMCIHVGTRLLFHDQVKLALVRHRGADAWRPLVAASGARFAPELAHEEDGRDYEVAVQDLRGLAPLAWLTSLTERSALSDWSASPAPPAQEAPLVALSQDDFRRSVRDALRALEERVLLAKNPLVHAHAVGARAPAGDDHARAAALRTTLLEAIASLDRGGREGVWRRVLTAAYVERAGKHEAIAAALGMSYASFRRHLAAGTEHVASRLWSRERA
jgi:hypothetical protein